jgi:hypothetical protein
MNPQLETYTAAIDRFHHWLCNQREPDGSLRLTTPACTAYTPLPLYALAIGDIDWLVQLLSVIEQRCHEDEARFLHPASGTLIPYRAAWLLMGAVRGEQLRLATWLERWLLRFQHHKTGAIFGTEADRQVGTGEICFDSTANICATLCLSGNLDEAERLGAFLRRFVEVQPDPERRFFTGWHSERGLITEFATPDPRGYVIEYGQPRQMLYKIGLLARAFALLGTRTGQSQYLKLAEAVHRTAVAKSPDVWSNTLAHKLGWSAYTLGVLTRKAEYTQDACHMADRLVALQQPDGAFDYPEFLPSYEQVSVDLKCNYGAQFTTWIAYARALLVLDGAG